MPTRSRQTGRRALAAVALSLVAFLAFSRLPYLSFSPTNITHNGHTPSDATQNLINGTGNGISMLAILCRYDENISWIIDPNTGIYNAKKKRFIVPIEIYQTADLEPHGALPHVPGLLPPPPTNLSHLSPAQLRALNYSNSQPRKLPTWPDWAWEWALEKNSTAGEVAPGSVEEAELLAWQAAGLPHPDHPPTTAAEWRAYESLSGWTAADSSNGRNPQGKTTGFNASKALKQKAKRVFGSPKRSTTVLAPDISPLLLRIIPNRGAEAMAYLTAIIDHYDDLPDLMIFGHSSRLSWHSIFGLDWTLRRLATHPPADPTLNSSNGYHAWNCLERWANDNAQLFPATIDASWRSPNGPMWHEALAARFAQAWDEHLGPALGGTPLPAAVRVPAAASFVATRAAILRRPKEFWMGLREWLLRTTIEGKWLGIVMEFATGVIFANQTIITYSQERCLCELYSICTGFSEI